ncbi:hypothetical protein H0H93_008873 [Arthromyces matolae]|nr:hypothetical protein H0H93_008873 [Arthromyces matolae]
MAGVDSGTGVAGSAFTHYNYPGIYQSQDFHYCGTTNNAILDYDNRTQVQTCQLEDLADLTTETEYVRGRLAEYANDLLSLGVDGLRLDAAKHMASTDIANITSRFTSEPYITQEVIWGAGEAVQPSEYVGIGDVQEQVSIYNRVNERVFEWGDIYSTKSRQPRLGLRKRSQCICRKPRHRETTATRPLMTVLLTAGLELVRAPDGTYCDVISGKSSSGVCTGIGRTAWRLSERCRITVSGGAFTATVASRSAIAVHTGALGQAPTTVAVTFQETATTVWGEV